LSLRAIPHRCEVDTDVVYKGVPIGTCRLDLIVAEKLIVELKAVEQLNQVHRAQTLTYLRLTKLSLALVINFNVPLLKDGIKRMINTI
jgi:GxxExxY protein